MTLPKLVCCLVAVTAMFPLAICGCSSTSSDSDAGIQDGGDPTIFQGCAFDFAPPEKHAMTYDMGGEFDAYDVQVLCSVDYEDTHLLVFMRARPIGTQYMNVLYEAKDAFVCEDAEVEELAEGQFYYGAFHHGWDAMEIAYQGFRYEFGWREYCAGWRPCTSMFDMVDIRRIDDGSLVAERHPAICVRLTENGNPRPLVPQVRVPAEGEDIVFEMGSTDGALDEQPLHQVSLSAFSMDIREASNADFAYFLNDYGNLHDGHPCVTSSGDGLKLYLEDETWKVQSGYEDHPVVQATWHGAEAYCRWRSWIYLPTEAQWEAAASALGTRSYPWGEDSPTCDHALFDTCEASEPEETISLEAGLNREGIYNLSGNVAEWIRDWYQEDFYANCPNDCRNPRGPENDTGLKVIRGGGFEDPLTKLKATTRNKADPTTSTKSLGLRCANRAGTPKFD